jgi:hypothetical protein
MFYDDQIFYTKYNLLQFNKQNRGEHTHPIARFKVLLIEFISIFNLKSSHFNIFFPNHLSKYKYLTYQLHELSKLYKIRK